MPREAYIIDAVRTPIGRGKPDGWLHGIHPVDLLAMTLDEVTHRAGCPKEAVDDVVAGCVTPAGDQARDVGRLATLKAGLPIDVPGVQINRFCGSGQQAIHFAAQAIRSGDMDIAIGCGWESMSRGPMFTDGKFSAELIREFP